MCSRLSRVQQSTLTLRAWRVAIVMRRRAAPDGCSMPSSLSSGPAGLRNCLLSGGRLGQSRGPVRRDSRGGRIPEEAAQEIAARCDLNGLDFDLPPHETDIVGYPILPLVHQLVKQCGEAGRYVHWGATTQDIMDTAVVLQVRDGCAS
jgi:hypothetical protein